MPSWTKGLAIIALLTPEQRKERSRKSSASMTSEQRKERSRKAGLAASASMTPEQRKERSRKGGKSGGVAGGHNSWPIRFKIYGNPGTSEGRAKAGRKNVESGQLLLASRAAAHVRPTWPEARFYGLVLGNSVTALGFTAQQSDGHGIYDGAWLDHKIIVELDGGGHHAFRDRRAEDTQKDILRMIDYNTVLRETDENILFLKILALLGET